MWLLVVALTLVLHNEPPKTIEAAPAHINNSVQPTSEMTEQKIQDTEAIAQITKQIEQPAPKPETEPKPEPKPVVSQASPVSCEVYRPIIEKYNWNTNIAMKIMDAESVGGPDGICFEKAVGDNYPIGGIHAPSCGLFQVRTLAGRPTCEQLHDPETNVAWAYKLYQGRTNWSDWSVCKINVQCY